MQKYNNAFAFMAFGLKSVQPPPPPGHGPTTFTIAGECYHTSTNLDAGKNTPQHAQLHVVDSAEQAAWHRNHHQANQQTVPELMLDLSELFLEHHAYAHQFKQAYQRLAEQPAVNLPITTRQNHMLDPRRYNRPTAQEIAVIVPDGPPDCERDICVYRQGGGWQQLSSWNPAYACLHYVLLFLFGEPGFQYGMPVHGACWREGPCVRAADWVANKEDPEEVEADPGRQKHQTISELEYYSYLFIP